MATPEDAGAGLAALSRHLKERLGAGVTHVWLSEETKERFRGLKAKARASAQAAGQPAPDSDAVRTPPTDPLPPAADTAPPDPASKPRPQSAGAASRTPPEGKAARLAAIAERAEHCARCRGLGTLRDTMVFATGNPDADLMFVGEAPGAEEERQREPFVGPAGQLLTKIIETMGLRRQDVYISNIVKFRPKIGDGTDQGSANRPPEPEEMAAAVEYVRAEIGVVAPKLIVALGGTAMTGLLGIDGSVGRARGTVHDCGGTPAIVTYHPSYLLRSGGKSEKRKVWEDMLFAMEQLGMPISERQRRFFS